jgi:hypothetical protein
MKGIFEIGEDGLFLDRQRRLKSFRSADTGDVIKVERANDSDFQLEMEL